MRIRRKPWVREELANSKVFVDNPMQNIGKWRKVFQKEQPIHLELGCGKGTFIAKLARQNPNINYIAIDIKSEVLGLAKRNIEKEYGREPIENVLIMSQEIALIQNIMNENDKVDRIYINFCNPWPKPRHHKKRLTYSNQLEKYKIFLKPEGEIYFKTDDNDLYKATIKYLKEANFEIIEQTENLEEKPIWENNIETEHEIMFKAQGIKIKALKAKVK